MPKKTRNPIRVSFQTDKVERTVLINLGIKKNRRIKSRLITDVKVSRYADIRKLLLG